MKIMDEKLFKIHSTRFYDVEPKAIHSMCYEDNRLALSRSDNSIEIWNIEHTPHIEKHIPGSNDGSVEAVVWSKGKLFSTGLHGFIVEYNLVTLSPKASYAVTSGSAWCLAVNKQHTHLAAGTEEGYVCIFEIIAEGLLYHKVLDKQEGRILSLSWHSSGEFIVTGSSDAIRVWNVETGHAVNRMSPGRIERNKETLVWCVAITDDFVIISGDSTGRTSFWDGKMGTPMDQVNAHKADVLCLCLSEDQQSVFSAGVDPVIVLFARVTLGGGRRQWIRSVQRVIHSHDVRSMALCGPKLLSGGVDAYLCISSYPPKSLSRYPPLPQPPCVRVAESQRLLLLCHPRSLDVWKLGVAAKCAHAPSANTLLKLSQEPAHLLQLHSKDDEWIVCSALSKGGQYLAYSTESNLRIYHFNPNSSGGPQLRKLHVPKDVGPCHRMVFIGETRLLLATPKLTLELLALSPSSDVNPVQVSQLLDKDGGLELGDCVHLMDASQDGKYAILADHSNKIQVIDVDSLSPYCVLPRYKSHPTALAFHPDSKLVVVAYADHKIIEYDVSTKQYTEFSRKLASHLPPQWINRSSTVRHVTFDPKHPEVIILHDDSVICTIDKTKDFSEPDAKVARFDTEDSLDNSSSNQTGSLERSPSQHLRTAVGGNSSFSMLKKYKHLAFLGSVDEAELVAVEVSPLSLEKHLPPALYKKRFGV